MNEAMWEQFDFDEIDQLLQRSSQMGAMSFRQLVNCFVRGDFQGLYSKIWISLMDLFVPGIADSRALFLQILIIGLLCLLLTQISGFIKSKQVTQLAYYFVYLFLMLLLLQQFDSLTGLSKNYIENCRQFIVALIPTFCLSLSLGVGSVTAASIYELFLLLLAGVDYILVNLLLPMTKCYLFLVLMDGIDGRGRFQGFVRLLEKVLGFVAKSCLVLTVSLTGIQNAVTISIDGTTKTALQKAISVIPGIGDVSEAATQVLLSSANLIKNCVGAAALFVLVYMSICPLVKLLCVAMTLKLTSAIVALLGQSRLSQVVDKAGSVSFMLTRITLCSGLCFFVCIALTIIICKGG